ncbi:MAG: hypothetical protein ACE5I1_06090, partial [bacterium]
FIYDDLTAMQKWMENAFRQIGREKKFNVRAVNVTAFGATVVHLNIAGELAAPVFSYMTEVQDDFHEGFVKTFAELPGGFARLATPPLGKFLNVAKQLFWLAKARRDIAKEISHSLFLPQYFIYILTDQVFSEPTTLGCHTGLWDFQNGKISRNALESLKWQSKIPAIVKNNAMLHLKKQYGSLLNARNEIIVGAGLHDSSSALVPFSRTLKENFVLVSTGTWIIAQNPGATFKLTEGDLAEDRLYYLTPDKEPVRAARLFGGREHEIQLERISKHFGEKPGISGSGSGSGKRNKLRSYLQGFFAERIDRSLVPAALQGTGPFPYCLAGDWNLGAFASEEEAYARLCLDLAVLTSYCIDSVASENSENIVVDGGFAKNEWFVEIVAILQVSKRLYVTEVPQATALGAAMMVHEQWAEKQKADDIVNLRSIESTLMEGLHVYAERFLAKMAADD